MKANPIIVSALLRECRNGLKSERRFRQHLKKHRGCRIREMVAVIRQRVKDVVEPGSKLLDIRNMANA